MTTCPVIDSKTKEVMGIVGLLDILTGTAFHDAWADMEEEEIEALTAKTMGKVITDNNLDEVFNTSITHYSGSEGGVQSFRTDEPLNKLIDSFSMGVNFAVVEDEKDASKLTFLTHTDVAEYIVASSKKKGSGLERLLNLSLEKVGLATVLDAAPEPATQGENALSAFRKMIQAGLMEGKEISAIPVVDKNEKFVDVLTAGDVTGIQLKTLTKLSQSTSDYLKNSRSRTYTKSPSLVASDTLGQTLEKMIAATSHTAVLVDDAQMPVRMVSLEEILMHFSIYSPSRKYVKMWKKAGKAILNKLAFKKT
jgi:CBS-domain-containing membrane protein